MIWVKVCGVRRLADVRSAEEAGADAVGLVVAPSPRRLHPEEAARLAAATFLETFLVTVDATPDELLDLAGLTTVSGVQPHGAHAAAAAAAAAGVGLRVLLPVAAGPGLRLDGIPSGQIPLVDSAGDEIHGGTGEEWDRRTFPAVDRPWVMAGGLGPGNVAAAVAELAPWGVDASSRLESSVGVKDPDLIKAYVKEAKSAWPPAS